MKLVECVPNFSEGRRPEVIEAICARIASVEGVKVLGREMDADHNRAVVTFVGGVAAAQEAAFRAIAAAAELIDLTQHEGAHPRMGATDVCPFVPLGETTMEDAVAAARQLAERVGNELGIPVFLYENAAVRDDRRSLPKIRKGGFEALRDAIGSEPDRAPDHGPARIHPTAGATAIGARFFLIAYNVNLDSGDVELAKKIAGEIREKNGGLPGVKAMGFHLEDGDIAQVSMNLVDYRKTSPGAAFAAVARKAAKVGVDVVESEVVGLIPQEAITRSFVDLTLPAEWSEDQVLESQLPGPDPLDACGPFLKALAGGTPTPGGGSAAALAGALSASLVTMVCNVTIGKKGYEEVQGDITEIRDKATTLAAELHTLVRLDAGAYDDFMVALRLPKDTDEQKETRRAALAEAAVQAARVPLFIMRKVVDVLELAVTAARKGNKNAVSDVSVAALLGCAAIRSADLNVRINLPSVKDLETRARLSGHANELKQKGEELEGRVMRAGKIS